MRNILILSPDRVGSTLLRYLFHVYMAAGKHDLPLLQVGCLLEEIDLEPQGDQFRILSKAQDPSHYNRWSVPQVLQALKDNSDQHQIISKLNHWNLAQRSDSQDDLREFYSYLNRNFFIVATRRSNMFELALSHSIRVRIGEQRAIFNLQDKLRYMSNFSQPIYIDPENIIKFLRDYDQYVQWTQRWFDVAAYWNYDEDLYRVDDWFQDLPGPTLPQWQEITGLSFNDWNRVHHLISDVFAAGTLIPQEYFAKLKANIGEHDRQFLEQNLPIYYKSVRHIEQLIGSGYVQGRIPMKITTLLEKRALVRNFAECMEAYNAWAMATGRSFVYDSNLLTQAVNKELSFWYQSTPQTMIGMVNNLALLKGNQ